MKLLKITGIAAVIGIAAILTAPFWGGCKVVYQGCKISCDIRHFNSDFKRAACKTSCGADRLSCISKK